VKFFEWTKEGPEKLKLLIGRPSMNVKNKDFTIKLLFVELNYENYSFLKGTLSSK